MLVLHWGFMVYELSWLLVFKSVGQKFKTLFKSGLGSRQVISQNPDIGYLLKEPKDKKW